MHEAYAHIRLQSVNNFNQTLSLPLLSTQKKKMKQFKNQRLILFVYNHEYTYNHDDEADGDDDVGKW